MTAFLGRLQALLGALAALGPLMSHSPHLRDTLALAGRALAAAAGAAANLDELAVKLDAATAEVEQLAATGARASPEQFKQALMRVHAASLELRRAVETAEAPP